MVLNNHDKAKFNDRVFEDIKIIETEGKNNSLISGRKDWSQLNNTRATIARHKTCFILWRTIVTHPKDLWRAIKKIFRYNTEGSP